MKLIVLAMEIYSSTCREDKEERKIGRHANRENKCDRIHEETRKPTASSMMNF